VNVVFLASDYVLHNRVVSDYVAARPGDRVFLVKVPLVLKGKGRLGTARRIVPRLSRRFLLGKLLEALVLAVVTVLPKVLGRGAVFRRLRRIARLARLPFLRTHDAMSDEALAFLRAAEPDFVVTLFHQIVRRPLLGIPRLGVVNIHPGLLPGFKGIQPYFWELAEGHGQGGVTLHLIEDETIDTGRILARASYATWPGMSVQLNYYLSAQAAARLLPRCLAELEANRLAPAPQPEGGAYYRWPDSAGFDRLEAAGHRLFSWRDLGGILAGRYDDFVAKESLAATT
jgi:folate-dependent phosphoribosylglycinamide formyltransferase PurN